MKRGILFVLLLMIDSNASARIGEWWEDVEMRYGHQVITGLHDEFGNHQFGYEFNGFAIIVTYVNKRSEAETFQKKNTSEPLFQKEIDAILEANKPAGASWIQDKVAGWITTDGKLRAIHAFNALHLSTKEYRNKVTTETRRREEEKLKGF